MSDIKLDFPLWVFVLLAPVILMKVIEEAVIPLALVVAGVWLGLSRRTLDIVLLSLALAGAIITIWLVDAPHTRSFILRAMIGCSTFAWLALLLLPFRWLVRGVIKAWNTPDPPAPPP